MTFNLFMLNYILLLFYSLIYLRIIPSQFHIFAQVIAITLIGIQVIYQYIKKENPIACRNYTNLIGLLTIFMFIMSLIHIFLNIGTYSISTIIQDVMAIIGLNSGFILTKNMNSNDKFLIKYLKFIGLLAIFSGIIAMLYADFSLGRMNVWKPQYIWWQLLFPWSFLLLYKIIIKKVNIFLTIAAYSSTGMYIILGLLFRKRIVLFHLFLILLVYIITKIKKRNLIIKVTKLSIIMLMIIFLSIGIFRIFPSLNFKSSFIDTYMRMKSVNIKDFDRFREFINLFKEYPYSIIITGAGLGSYQHGPGGINLHIGWLNFVYKGGILFLFIELWVFILSLKIIFRSKNNWHKYIAACVVFSYLSIIISSSWVATPVLINFSIMKFSLLRIISNKY